ncbi:hypothetical protein EDD18DRAFT_1343980 [Armillaria luteobubalina]|uniref:Uncharacterized protein n=1 Tax=Armillaria luteobubalina TaxID=153913 RepID=A0AA39QNQ3_9AGAR|nr:hypothetical protein EDD18DRAFT_1343980 [Armillaria luteobubalina]
MAALHVRRANLEIQMRPRKAGELTPNSTAAAIKFATREVIISPSTPEEGRDRPDAIHETTHMDLALQNKIDTDRGKKACHRLRKLFALWTQAQRVARMFKRLAKDGG